jgi:PAS domain S-box-containing protein
MTDLTLPELREAEAKYRGMFENAVEGIYQSTPDGRYLAVNPALAKMYGYDRADELLNRVSDISAQIYVDPAFREIFRREIEQKGFIHGLEYQVRRRDGSIIWISESARAVTDASGAVRYYEGFIDDITARKEAEGERTKLEKQMLHSQKMDAIGTLAGGMAHDFNNILCAMLGYTELALLDQEIKGVTRDNLAAVLKSAERATELVKRILTFSRQTDTERRPLKLSEIVMESVQLLNAMLPSSIRIAVDFRTGEDVVVADGAEMHQVIMNLGTNAGHAMRATGGQLKYELDLVELTGAEAAKWSLPPGEYIHLAVSDTGRGMSPEVMEKIFDPFFTTKSVGRGTGLGLTLVQKIIKQSSGHIAVESEPGRGTTFHIHLPKSPLPPAPPKVDEKKILRGKREKILIVDDEVPLLNMMQQRLRQIGYRVITRADSPDALETFRDDPQHFDLVITDHTMPALQGAELSELLGEIRPDVPVILMTGLNQPPDFHDSRFAALRAVVQKPINFVELSHRLRDFLD